MKKMKNYLKTGILLLGIFISVLSCEKEENQIQINNSLSEQLQNEFNLDDYSKIIPYDFEVNWNNPTKLYSEELKMFYYEFPVNYTSILNPIELNKQNKNGKFYVEYKIFVTEKDINDFNFYALKFYQNVGSLNVSSFNSNVSFNNVDNFNGFIHIIDKENDIVFAKELNKGKLINKIFKQKEFKNSNFASKEIQNCQTLYIPNYTDWYKKTIDPITGKENVEFTHTELTGYSYQEVCYSSIIPEINPFGGNPDGIYLNNGNPGLYTNETIILIEDEIKECGEGFVQDENGDCVEITVANVPPDCESFNYSRVGANNWQCAAVSGIRELFTVFNWECTGFDFGYLPQAIYFQLPINSNFPLGSGYTKTESAVALHEAFKLFDSWYKSNACTSSYPTMTNKFIQFIKDEFEDIGGNATVTPPLGYTGSITPYQYTWSGYGNCN